MHAIQAPRRLAMSPRLSPKTMANAAEFDRKLLRVERLVEVHTAERNLGRANQAEIGVLDRIDLRFRPARIEADAFQNLVLRQVRRRRQRETFLEQNIQGVS